MSTNDPIHSEVSEAAPAVRREPRLSSQAVIAGALIAATLTGSVFGSAVTAAFLAGPGSAASAASSVAVSNPLGGPGLRQAAAAPSGNATTTAGQVYQKVAPAIVEVLVTGAVTRRGATPDGSGSGIVIDAQGHILTNEHVVDGASAVQVRFSTGDERSAQVVGTDRGNDVALLKVDLPAGVPAAVLGDSDQVQVGDVAIAIGSPFGLEETVTQGIISAVHRDWQPSGGVLERDMLQTDAPINPGNSGGALLNAAGEVVGLTNAIESPVRGSVGVNFAIPINRAKQLLPQLTAGAKLEPAWLGIRGQALTADVAQAQGLSVQNGIWVAEVVTGGPADQAGVQANDVITAMDGQALTTFAQLSTQIANHKVGDTLKLKVERGGQSVDLTVTLQARPANQ